MNKINHGKPFAALALAVSLFAGGTVHAGWLKAYGTKNSEAGFIMPSSQGGYYLSMLSTPSGSNAKSAPLLSLLNSLGNPAWTRKITTGAYDGFFVSELNNGRLLVQGSTKATQNGLEDALWAVYNVDRATGTLTPVFQKAYKGTGDDQLTLMQDSQGVLWGTGSTTTFSQNGTSDIVVAKINSSNGTPVWSKVFDYAGNNDSLAGFMPKGNQFIVLANTESANGGNQKILIGLLNNLGVPVLASFKKYGDANLNEARGIKAIAGGKYLVYGVSKTSVTDPNPSIFVMKLDAQLKLLWATKYSAGADMGLEIGEVNENADSSIAVNGRLSKSSVIIVSGFPIPLPPAPHPLTLKISSTGAVVFAKIFEYQASDIANFSKDSDGSYLLGGQTMAMDLSGASSLNVDMLYGHFSSDFVPSWVKTLGGAKLDSGLIRSKTAGYWLSGITNSFGSGGIDVLAGELDSNGEIAGCSNIKDIVMTETAPNITAGKLLWQAQAVTLTNKGAIRAVNKTLTVSPATMTAKPICSD